MHIEKEDSHATIFQDTHSKLLQSGHKGLFNQCKRQHGTDESYPYTHGEGLWNQRQLDFGWRKYLQKTGWDLGKSQVV